MPLAGRRAVDPGSAGRSRAAVHQLEDGELVAAEGVAAELGEGLLVAQEHHVEVVDLALDEVPLVDAPHPLHQDLVARRRMVSMARTRSLSVRLFGDIRS